MSLIMDALKKAQQLRLKEPQGTSLPSPLSANKKGLRGLDRWVLAGIGLASLILFGLIFWRLFTPPTKIPIQTAARKEIKTFAPVGDKKTQLPSKDIRSPGFIEGPEDILSSPKDTPSVLKETAFLSKEVPSLPKHTPRPESIKGPKDVLRPQSIEGSKGGPIEKSSPKTEPSIKEKRTAPPIKQMVAEQKVKQTVPPTKGETEKGLPTPAPSLPASLNEKAPDKSIEVKPEGEKDRPSSSEILTHFNLGVQFYNQREFLKAIQAYQKVIELDSTYVEAYNNLGIVYQEMGDVDRAFGAYQKSVEINPRYEKGYNNLGILLYLKGRNEEAVEAFQKALAINSNNIESHINLGVLFKKQGQWDKAIESYRKALTISPFHKEIHYNIALLYEQLENTDMAIAHYQQFIKLSSPSYSDLVLRVRRHLDELIKAKKEKTRESSGGR